MPLITARIVSISSLDSGRAVSMRTEPSDALGIFRSSLQAKRTRPASRLGLFTCSSSFATTLAAVLAAACPSCGSVCVSSKCRTRRIASVCFRVASVSASVSELLRLTARQQVPPSANVPVRRRARPVAGQFRRASAGRYRRECFRRFRALSLVGADRAPTPVGPA